MEFIALGATSSGGGFPVSTAAAMMHVGVD
jgi:hypothetical protein